MLVRKKVIGEFVLDNARSTRCKGCKPGKRDARLRREHQKT